MYGNSAVVGEPVRGGVDAEAPHRGQPGRESRGLQRCLEEEEAAAAVLRQGGGGVRPQGEVAAGDALHHRGVDGAHRVQPGLAGGSVPGELLHLEGALRSADQRIGGVGQQPIRSLIAGAHHHEGHLLGPGRWRVGLGDERRRALDLDPHHLLVALHLDGRSRHVVGIDRHPGALGSGHRIGGPVVGHPGHLEVEGTGRPARARCAAAGVGEEVLLLHRISDADAGHARPSPCRGSPARGRCRRTSASGAAAPARPGGSCTSATRATALWSRTFSRVWMRSTIEPSA